MTFFSFLFFLQKFQGNCQLQMGCTCKRSKILEKNVELMERHRAIFSPVIYCSSKEKLEIKQRKYIENQSFCKKTSVQPYICHRYKYAEKCSSRLLLSKCWCLPLLHHDPQPRETCTGSFASSFLSPLQLRFSLFMLAAFISSFILQSWWMDASLFHWLPGSKGNC